MAKLKPSSLIVFKQCFIFVIPSFQAEVCEGIYEWGGEGGEGGVKWKMAWPKDEALGRSVKNRHKYQAHRPIADL